MVNFKAGGGCLGNLVMALMTIVFLPIGCGLLALSGDKAGNWVLSVIFKSLSYVFIISSFGIGFQVFYNVFIKSFEKPNSRIRCPNCGMVNSVKSQKCKNLFCRKPLPVSGNRKDD